MWQLAIFFYFVFGATSYVLRRILAQRLGGHIRAMNAIFFVCFLLPAAVFLSFFFPHNLDVGTTNLLLLLGGSIIWPLFSLVAFRANKTVDVGIFTIISNLSPLATLVIAVPFLGEFLSVRQLAGVGLLILSGALAASSQLGKKNRVNMPGILLCLLSATILGVAIAYERFMLNRIDFGTYLIFGWGSQVLWAVILAGKELQKIPQLLHKNADSQKILVAWGATSALKSVAFITALKVSGSAALISAASDFLSVAVVFAAYIYLKERDHMVYKWSAAFVGALGLLLLAK